MSSGRVQIRIASFGALLRVCYRISFLARCEEVEARLAKYGLWFYILFSIFVFTHTCGGCVICLLRRVVL